MATLNVVTVTDLAKNIPDFWAEEVIMDAHHKAFWTKHEGAEGSSKPIIRKDDPLKNAGDEVKFTTLAEMLGDGKSGAETLAGNEEKIKIDDFSLTVDFVRHATAWNKRADLRSIMNVPKWAKQLLSTWFANKTDNDLFDQLIATDTPTTLYANDATSDATLEDDCTFGVNEIQRILLELEAMGAEPFTMDYKNGEEVPVYGIVISEFDAYHLKNDALWWKLAEVDVRGEMNRALYGCIGRIFNALIYVKRGIRGINGTPLRPETKIYGTHTDAVTTITVGTDDGRNYTKHFDSSGTLSIVNSSGATEFVTYTGKTAYTFTGCTRGVTYGSVTSTASAYTGNERITQNNFLSHAIGFGSKIAIRSFAKAMHMIEQTEDYGFEIGLGVEAVYGQKAIKNTRDVNANYILMKTNSKPPEAS
jgi:N4-gp56 family major capsid protein